MPGLVLAVVVSHPGAGGKAVAQQGAEFIDGGFYLDGGERHGVGFRGAKAVKLRSPQG
jgi:hypothetical protein